MGRTSNGYYIVQTVHGRDCQFLSSQRIKGKDCTITNHATVVTDDGADLRYARETLRVLTWCPTLHGNTKSTSFRSLEYSYPNYKLHKNIMSANFLRVHNLKRSWWDSHCVR